jgi:hypothetical protein
MTKFAALLAGCAALAGCAEGIPKDALTLAPRSLEQRQIESRRFDGIQEEKLLAACAGVLQDLGFNIDESETKLGLIVSSKDRSATDSGQVAAAVLLAVLTGTVTPVERNQKIRASLAVRPAGPGRLDSHIVRITLQRIVWNTENQITRQEWLKDPKLYQEFYEKLSKAVFLEAQEI